MLNSAHSGGPTGVIVTVSVHVRIILSMYSVYLFGFVSLLCASSPTATFVLHNCVNVCCSFCFILLKVHNPSYCGPWSTNVPRLKKKKSEWLPNFTLNSQYWSLSLLLFHFSSALHWPKRMIISNKCYRLCSPPLDVQMELII